MPAADASDVEWDSWAGAAELEANFVGMGSSLSTKPNQTALDEMRTVLDQPDVQQLLGQSTPIAYELHTALQALTHKRPDGQP